MRYNLGWIEKKCMCSLQSIEEKQLGFVLRWQVWGRPDVGVCNVLVTGCGSVACQRSAVVPIAAHAFPLRVQPAWKMWWAVCGPEYIATPFIYSS